MGLIVEVPTKVRYEQGRGMSVGNARGNSPRGDSSLLSFEEITPPCSTAIWVGIAAIVMMFAALTSALVVRQGASTDWHHFDLPKLLYLNTLVLAISSLTLEMFGLRFRRGLSCGTTTLTSRWLYATVILGGIFICGQYVAWCQLTSEGIYLASNPSHSFFYVLTGAHVLHVLGGIVALLNVIVRFKRHALQSTTLAVATKYWYCIDLLWVYLLGLLWLKL